METINISQFMGYFSSYYPIILPVFVALCIISAYVLDLLRVWTIAYVDEGETGPYKRYVSTFLHKLVGNVPPDDLTSLKNVERTDAINLKSYCGNYSKEGGNHCISFNGVKFYFKYQFEAEELAKFIAKYPYLDCEELTGIIADGGRHVMCKADYKIWDPAYTCFTLFVYLVLSSMLLTSYKFLPAITVGTIIGYCVLRLARSIVRLTKKFNKHISDGHGVKVEATEAKEML